MSHQRTEYANAILGSYPPVQAAELIRQRLNSAKVMNDEIADYLKERIRIEEEYASELERLSRRPPIEEIGHSGLFEPVWRQITLSVHETAKTSSSYAKNLRKDAENPIRNFSTKSTQWSDIRTLHEGLSQIAKNFTNNEDKVTKLKKKSGRGEKTATAQSTFDEARSQWENQAPFVFDQFQTVDEARLIFLKDALIRLETLEADKSQALSSITERTINSILSFEPLDEIQRYSVQVGSHQTRDTSNGHTHGTVGNSDHLARSSTGQTVDSLYDSPHSVRPRASVVSEETDSIHSRDAPSFTSGGGSKLRSKVGSIFRSSKNKNKLNSSEKHQPRQNTTVKTRSSLREVEEYTPSSISTKPATISRPPPPPSRKVNGSSGTDPTNIQQGGRTIIDDDDLPLRPNGNITENVGPTEIPGPTEVDQSDAVPIRIDIRQDVITEEKEDADVALSNVASTLRSRPTVSGRGQRGRRDIQSRLFTNIEASNIEGSSLPPVPIVENEEPSVTAAISPLTKEHPVEWPVAPQQSSPVPASPPVEAQSLRSLRSSSFPTLTSSVSHPNLPSSPGLHASVVEVVNCDLKDGAATQAAIIGEVAFSYNLEEDSTVIPVVDLKVGNLAYADRIFPNQAFIQPTNQQNGNYRVKTKELAEARTGMIGLKYMVKDPNSFVPIIFTPIWRIEEHQSSLMLTYKIADSFHGVAPFTISDLVIGVPVEGGLATSAQSKPVAAFNKDRQRVTWRFNEPITLNKGVEERLLCRFLTDAPAHEGSSGIDIKFRISNISASPDSGLVLEHKTKERDPFLDEGEDSEFATPQASRENLAGTSAIINWVPVDITKTLLTGKYTAYSEHNVQKK